MPFVVKAWQDREVEHAGRVKLKDLDTGIEQTVDVTKAEGNVIAEGDKFSADNMNDLEGRIKSAINAASANIDNLSDSAATVEDANTGLIATQSKLSFLDAEMESVSNAVGALQAEVDSLSTAVTDLKTLADGLEVTDTNDTTNPANPTYVVKPASTATTSATATAGSETNIPEFLSLPSAFKQHNVTDGVEEPVFSTAVALIADDNVGVDSIDTLYLEPVYTVN